MPLRLASMTWQDVQELDRERAVAILPVGAIEAHGPHLPLVTDGIIAEAMASAGASRILAEGRPAVLLPTFDYVAAPFAASFPGTISVRPETVTQLLVDMARSLAEQGFRTLAIANAHLDPAHLGAIHAAAEICNGENVIEFVFPDLTQKPWAQEMSDEFKSGACHAGQYETSVVMAVRPDLVREGVRRQLPGNGNSLSTAIQEGKSRFEEAGGSFAYFGYPAEATATEGTDTVRLLGDILFAAVMQAEPAVT